MVQSVGTLYWIIILALEINNTVENFHLASDVVGFKFTGNSTVWFA